MASSSISQLKKTIKVEPTTPGGSGRNERLSSLKIPRDLTLGSLGVVGKSIRGGANKKVFTPNLNVVRNKNTYVERLYFLK